MATQYIDDNPETWPINDENWLTLAASPFWNQTNLAKYHFVLWTKEGGGAAVFSTDKNLANPMDKSPQLNALYNYAESHGTFGCLNTSLQFMGEFLHAFEDTFAHRKADNTPFGVRIGFGHGLDGSAPDYTYNHGNWKKNADRTAAMEGEVHAKISDYMAKINYQALPERTGKVTPLDNAVLSKALLDFNNCEANEGSDKGANFNPEQSGCQTGSLHSKISILSEALADLGYSGELVWSAKKQGDATGYNEGEAQNNRLEYFKGLNQADYQAAKLPARKQ